MRSLRFFGRALVGVALLVVLVALVFPLPTSGTFAVAPSSPSAGGAAPGPLKLGGAGSAPPAAIALPVGAPPRAANQPAVSCDTPSGLPIWDSSNFFSDVLVSFYTPGQPGLSGSSFQIMPCGNTLPTYANGFWMNISTNVPMTQAIVRVWGVGWPGDSTALPINGFDPTNVSIIPMNIVGPLFTHANFYFNNYRFFWPGSTVYFNVTLVSVNATPSTIYSARGIYSHPVTYSGVTNNATWTYGVQGPFLSSNFTQDIAIRTTPSVLSNPVYEPNRQQTFQVILDSINASGGPGGPIPQAQLNVTLAQPGQEPITFPVAFGPANHSEMRSVVLGPYPNSTVQFHVWAWLPWGLTQTRIDAITSPTYGFNWTPAGGWWYPTGQFTDNLVYTTSPGVLGTTTTVLPTATPVNVSVQVRTVQNVTITGPYAGSEVHFRFTDASGSTSGAIKMNAIGDNASYALLPGLPAGGTLTFYTVVKDLFGNPISSGNTTYTEKGPSATLLPLGYSIFYFEGVDLSTGHLIPSLNFTLSNNSWSETGTGSAMGFAFPFPVSAPGILPVAWGTYVLTIRAFGSSQTASFSVTTLSNQTPTTYVFYLASAPVSSFSSVPITTFSIVTIAGIAGAAVFSYPIVNWFSERRKKTEEEQRRITL